MQTAKLANAVSAAARDQEYCETCVKMDHEVCWFGDPAPNCRCCLATLAAIEAAEEKKE